MYWSHCKFTIFFCDLDHGKARVACTAHMASLHKQIATMYTKLIAVSAMVTKSYKEGPEKAEVH